MKKNEELVTKGAVKNALEKLRWSVETDDPSLEADLDWEDLEIRDKIVAAIDALPAMRKAKGDLVSRDAIFELVVAFMDEIAKLVPETYVHAAQMKRLSAKLGLDFRNLPAQPCRTEGEIRGAIGNAFGGDIWFHRRVLSEVLTKLFAPDSEKQEGGEGDKA